MLLVAKNIISDSNLFFYLYNFSQSTTFEYNSDLVFTDSNIEWKFVEDLDGASEVVVYARLPRSFQIPTPVGNYAPDWAIAFDKDKVKHVFFIAETKGADSLESMELSIIEKNKIKCAEKLFNVVSTRSVKYKQVKNFEELKNYIGLKK